MSSTESIYIIGENTPELNENADIDIDPPLNLTQYKPNMKHIYFGYDFVIYSDADYKCLFGSGCNAWGNGEAAVRFSRELIRIQYFNENKINIKKILTNVASECVFWITTENKIYGTGNNIHGQLGLGDRLNDRYEPELISSLEDVIDIASSEYYSIALCSSSNNIHLNMITFYWSRLYNIPNDIANLIIIFAKYNTVYSTEYSEYGGNGQTNKDKKTCDQHKDIWSEIKAFKDKDIIKISVGDNHSLFLESNGMLWSCGYNSNGELGLGHTDHMHEPTEIKYFSDNNIRIKDIDSGCGHNLAIDYNDKVYSWGSNDYGQCGHGTQSTQNKTDKPKLIEFFKHLKVDKIGCGSAHSFCRTSDGKHYLFGRGYNTECLVDNDSYTTPICVDETIRKRYNNKAIASMSLGYQTTSFTIFTPK